jgi:hypothetical protein
MKLIKYSLGLVVALAITLVSAQESQAQRFHKRCCPQQTQCCPQACQAVECQDARIRSGGTHEECQNNCYCCCGTNKLQLCLDWCAYDHDTTGTVQRPSQGRPLCYFCWCDNYQCAQPACQPRFRLFRFR